MYIHPGKAFIEQYGLFEGLEAVEKYAHFLREVAGVTDDPPIDLTPIFQSFDIPLPTRTALAGQQGLVLNSETGMILIEESDRPTRQRFTEAHELMELFFEAVPKQPNVSGYNVSRYEHCTKERLCDRGAAELLMPKNTALPQMRRYGISFIGARQLAHEYEVSFLSALIRMTELGSGRHAVVRWRMKNKPTEIKRQPPEEQMPLFEIAPARSMPRLRVEWSICNPSDCFIPKDKSIPDDCLIVRAWRDHCPTEGTEFLDLGRIRGSLRSENQPFRVEGEWQVLSLLHLPGDADCGPQL